MITLKQGVTFDCALVMPAVYPDGFFLGWTLQSEIRTTAQKLIQTLTATWIAPASTTRNIRLLSNTTAMWPVGIHEFDARLTSPTGKVVATETHWIEIRRSATQL
jgi:hypothetical protein